MLHRLRTFPFTYTPHLTTVDFAAACITCHLLPTLRLDFTAAFIYVARVWVLPQFITDWFGSRSHVALRARGYPTHMVPRVCYHTLRALRFLRCTRYVFAFVPHTTTPALYCLPFGPGCPFTGLQLVYAGILYTRLPIWLFTSYTFPILIYFPHSHFITIATATYNCYTPGWFIYTLAPLLLTFYPPPPSDVAFCTSTTCRTTHYTVAAAAALPHWFATAPVWITLPHWIHCCGTPPAPFVNTLPATHTPHTRFALLHTVTARTAAHVPPPAYAHCHACHFCAVHTITFTTFTVATSTCHHRTSYCRLIFPGTVCPGSTVAAVRALVAPAGFAAVYPHLPRTTHVLGSEFAVDLPPHLMPRYLTLLYTVIATALVTLYLVLLPTPLPASS